MVALRVTLSLAVLAFGAIVPAARASGEASEQEVRAPDHLARDILANPSYQRELVPQVQGHRPRSIRIRRGSGGGPGGGSVVGMLAWLAVAAALGLAALWLAASFRRRRADGVDAAAEQDVLAEAMPDPSLRAAEDLAAQGRFAAAVHTLFLLSVRRLARRRNRTVADSLTGRELTRSLPASDGERRILGLLADTVERHLFGGQSIDRAAWERCHAAFGELEP